MRIWLAVVVCSICVSVAQAQGPRREGRGPGGPGGPNERGGGAGATVESCLARLMSLDANRDDKLTSNEVADPRLQALMQRCDANQDGVVTKDELRTQLTQEFAELPADGGGPGGPRGGPGAGGPGTGGPGAGAGGPGGAGFGPPPGGPPRPGQVLPGFVQEQLNLSAEQREQLAELQRDVDARLAKILTPEQAEQLRNLRPGPPAGPPPEGDANPQRGRGTRQNRSSTRPPRQWLDPRRSRELLRERASQPGGRSGVSLGDPLAADLLGEPLDELAAELQLQHDVERLVGVAKRGELGGQVDDLLLQPRRDLLSDVQPQSLHLREKKACDLVASKSAVRSS